MFRASSSILLLLSLTSSCRGTSTCSDVKGYYWRDYTGKISADAFLVAQNTYVGQALHSGLIIPGRIDGSDGKMYYEWGLQEYQGIDNIKVLCTAHPEKLDWIPTTNTNFKHLIDRHLVVGGYEPGHKVFIGRASLGHEIVLGKIQVRATDLNVVLHSTTRSHESIQYYQFEVLTYLKDEEDRIPLLQSRFGEEKTGGCKKITINMFT